MTTLVLVPRAWLVACAWRDVTSLLVKAGHDVYPVTLTGLAERAGEGDESQPPEPGDSATHRPISLDTHIDDITRLLDERDLSDVVLVGHSYAGAPVTGAADRRPERVAALVYVDSGPVPDGVAPADFNPPEARAVADREAGAAGGWLAPIAFDPATDPVTLAGLDDTMLSALRARATPHPYATMTQTQRLTGAVDNIPKTLIACTIPLDVVRQMIDSGNPFFAGLKDATLLTLPTGHWPMFSEPDALAEMLATTPH
jgi:pimeloyl-ACP methyl ester carboxylesterase